MGELAATSTRTARLSLLLAFLLLLLLLSLVLLPSCCAVEAAAIVAARAARPSRSTAFSQLYAPLVSPYLVNAPNLTTSYVVDLTNASPHIVHTTPQRSPHSRLPHQSIVKLAKVRKLEASFVSLAYLLFGGC
jgi:hypothetical protein